MATSPSAVKSNVDKESGEYPDLDDECREIAAYWRRQLSDSGHAIVRPPFVLAGDLDETALQAWYDQTVHPAARAMAERYFERLPTRPVSILLFHDEATYRNEAKRLFGTCEISRHGYYLPHLNTVVVNAAAGRLALLHELTHALMAFDFPEAPAWLREGLATLHEDCQIDATSASISPGAEARKKTLQEALQQGCLPSLGSLLRAPRFYGSEAPVYYALARHFCLFLGRQGALEPVYRTVRAGKRSEADSAAVILEELGHDFWDKLETRFRTWASESHHPHCQEI